MPTTVSSRLACASHRSSTFAVRGSGQRHINGGRAPARKALYMAALCASIHNPLLRAFYQRLRAEGRAAKVALTAVMRKLLLHLNSILKAPIQTTV